MVQTLHTIPENFRTLPGGNPVLLGVDQIIPGTVVLEQCGMWVLALNYRYNWLRIIMGHQSS